MTVPEDLGCNLFAVRCDARKPVSTPSMEEVVDAVRSGVGVVVGYLRVLDKERTSDLLLNRFGFDPLAVEDAMSPNERPAMHDEEHGLFLVFAAIRSGEGDDQYAEIGVFVGKNFLLAVCEDEPPSVTGWFKRVATSPKTPGTHPGMHLHSLLDAVVDDYFPACDAVEDDVDLLEEHILAGGSETVGDVLRLKRRLLEMRRRVTPIREVLNSLLRSDGLLMTDDVKRYLQDVFDHTLRLAETIDVNREILGGVLDAHLATVSNNLNIAMRVLTAAATFLMTASLIAGIYGMNFAFMPELRQAWGYPFALGLMALCATAEWVYFRRKGWF
jgi:magnesium transporter